jgi:hypothetical protein
MGGELVGFGMFVTEKAALLDARRQKAPKNSSLNVITSVHG